MGQDQPVQVTGTCSQCECQTQVFVAHAGGAGGKSYYITFLLGGGPRVRAC